jgi:NTP pyrophosphatase (non-canonical NTP hydrolase)
MRMDDVIDGRADGAQMSRLTDVCAEALKRYGAPAQVNMTKEECAELIVALSHFERGRGSKAEIAEEIADVAIMLEQMTLMLGPEGPVMVSSKVTEKVIRLEERLKR